MLASDVDNGIAAQCVRMMMCHPKNVHMNIRPVQKPRPPIWMAANNDPAVKRHGLQLLVVALVEVVLA